MDVMWSYLLPILPALKQMGPGELGKKCTYLMFGGILNILARYALTARFFSFGLDNSLLADFTLILSGIFGHLSIQYYAENGAKFTENQSEEHMIQLAITGGIYLVLGFVYAALFAINIGVRGCVTVICLLYLLKIIKGRFPSVNRQALLLRMASTAVSIIHTGMCVAAVLYSIVGIVQVLTPDFAAARLVEVEEAFGELNNYSTLLGVCMSFGLSYYCVAAVFAAILSGFTLLCEKRTHFPNVWAFAEQDFLQTNPPPPYAELTTENSVVFDSPPPYAETDPKQSSYS